MNTEARDCLVRLHETEGIGWMTIRRLADAMGGVDRIALATAADLRQLGLSGRQARLVEAALAGGGAPKRVRPMPSAVGECRAVTVLDREYPEQLRHIARPPWVIYIRGDPAVLSVPSVAVVGTRKPTAYGRRMADELAAGLAFAGIVVVSGLARGIDGAAHLGALRAGGVTVAVLGSGLDRVYPPEHAALAERIVRSGGAVVSEYPPGTLPRAGLFPERNRIIAGLSLGTVVVEASEKSGAMITASLAADAGREVFAVPGLAGAPTSRGVHLLLREGAKLTETVDDILQEIRGSVSLGQSGQTASFFTGAAQSVGDERRSVKPPTPPENVPEWTPDERRILEIVGFEPVMLDRIWEQSGFGFGHLHEVLLSLTVKRAIIELPGPSYARIR
ncbi:MAG: DNA protecting protein DprA [Candidatus Reconcilbacillus cellulovorans]|mgnify:FL=1|uniref:DNA protecting protein DprA n=1 Tax=Candidatus Reconcilbacillus cellulovorans TaxID=1906605 RepID=A0A2A6E2K3_9BACL|nr:MAG: DNA protecting protein DprA [Candidatus Reconcilbacillus cellulovorans]